MLTFRKWLEALHSYDDPNALQTQFQPLKKGDTFRVFHGFNSFKDAYQAAVYGITGRQTAQRRYSYESDNNPYGLFVTLNLKKAIEFVGSFEDQVVMEFIAKESDLESPVWPGGSYTVQGQMAKFFGRGKQGELKRRQRRGDAQKEVEDFLNRQRSADFQHIRQSDDKYKANILLNSTEYQALFIGDLNPQDITAFHVRAKGAKYNAPFERLTRAEFLQKYGAYQEPSDYNSSPKDRIFMPGEEFDGEKFLQGVQKRYKYTSPDNILRDVWRSVANSKDKRYFFIDSFKNLLWPKQYAKAMWFMKNRYGEKED